MDDIDSGKILETAKKTLLAEVADKDSYVEEYIEKVLREMCFEKPEERENQLMAELDGIQLLERNDMLYKKKVMKGISQQMQEIPQILECRVSSWLSSLDNPIMLKEATWYYDMCTSRGIKSADAKVSTGSKLTQRQDDRIRWGLGQAVSSIVDVEKLAKAEARAQEKQQKKRQKRQKKTTMDESQILEMAYTKVKSKDIELSNFDVSINGKPIITDGSARLIYGQRIGIVGRNGVGKSTFLKMIAERELDIPKWVRVHYVEQEKSASSENIVTCVIKSHVLRETLLAREEYCMKKLESGTESERAIAKNELTMITEKLDGIGSSYAEATVKKILNGLGFTDILLAMRECELSGGWQVRSSLAKALFNKPDLLLLDEPTNMLDVPSITWLVDYLKTWEGTVLVVSHDRDFLDELCTTIFHLHHEKLEIYNGNYSAFLHTREARKLAHVRMYEENQRARSRYQAFIDRWLHSSSSMAQQAISRIKMLDKLPLITPLPEDPPIKFRFLEVEKRIQCLLRIENISFAYESSQRNILQGVSMNVQGDARIAIVGPNGAGKSTLLGLVTGSLQPSSGQIIVDNHTRIGYFSQYHVDTLDLSVSSLEYFRKKFPTMSDNSLIEILSGFGISGSLFSQPIYTLSGGQKSRVMFAIISSQKPNLLILDEPTNHLDIDSIDALVECLEHYKGAAVIVSHDCRFINMTCKDLYICNNQTMVFYQGLVSDYVKSLLRDAVF